MLPWQIWLIISGVCFIAEIATVGFLVFWFGVAALITCLLSLFISNVIAQPLKSRIQEHPDSVVP